MTMRTWVGVDSTSVPHWHTEAETRWDCRQLIRASFVEEGDVLLEATLLDVSWTKVAENAGHPAGAVGSASDRVAERMLRDPSFT